MSYLSRWLVFAFLLSLCSVFVSPVWASGEVQANVALEAGLFPLPEDAVVSAVLAGEDSSLKATPPLAASANFINGRQIMLQSVAPRLTRKAERDILMLRRGDKALLLGHSFAGNQQVVLGAESTAVSLVLFHPSLLGLTAEQQQQVVLIIQSRPHFAALVKRLRGVLKVDQSTPLDYLIHPFLGMDVTQVAEETIATPDFKARIATVQLQQYAAEQQKQVAGTEKQGFVVDCQDKEGNTVEDCRKAANLSITNPKAIYYGAYIDPAKSDILDAKEGLINFELGLYPPKFEINSSQETKFGLDRFGTGADSYQVHLVSNYGSSWNPLDAEGWATWMNSIKGVSLMIELAGLVPEGKSKTKDWITAKAQKLKGFQDSIIDKGKARWAIIASKAMTEVMGIIYDATQESSKYKEPFGEIYYGLKKFSTFGDKLIDLLKLDPLQPEEIAFQRDYLITTVFKKTNITELLAIIKSGQGLDVIYSKVQTELLVVIQQKFSFVVLNSDFPFDYDTVLQKISGCWTSLETEGVLDSMLGVLLNDFTDEAAKAIGDIILRNAFGLPYKMGVASNKIIPYVWDMYSAPDELTFPVYNGTLKALSEPNVAALNITRNGQSIYRYLANDQSATPDFVRINPGDCINIYYRIHMPESFEQGVKTSSDGFFSWFAPYPVISTFGAKLDARFERKPWSHLYDRTHLLTTELSVYRSGFDWLSPHWKYYRYDHGLETNIELDDNPENWASAYQSFKQNDLLEIENPLCFSSMKDIPDQLFLSFNNFAYESTGQFIVNLRHPNQSPTINSVSVHTSAKNSKSYVFDNLDFIDDYTRNDDIKLEVDFGDGQVNTYPNQASYLLNIQHQYASAGTYTVKITAIDDEGARSSAWSTTIYPGQSYPDLEVNPGVVNFGSVELGKSSDSQVTITNAGYASLQISSFNKAGDDFSILNNTCASSLAPGKSCVITMHFTPTVLNLMTGTLNVSSNDPNASNISIKLLGYGVTNPNYPVDYAKVFEPYEVERKDGTKYTVDTFNPSGVIYGNVWLKSGILDLKNSDLTIYGHLIQSGGTLNVNGGKLLVTGDYRIQTPDGKGGYTASGGVLYMVNEADKVTVNGSFVMDSTQSHGGNFQNGGQYFGGNYLQAGTLEVKGDFTQQSTDAFVYANYDFYAQGTHKVILSGTGTQKVSFEDGASGASRFANLDIQNGTARAVSFPNGVPAANTFSYAGDTLYLENAFFPQGLAITPARNLNLTVSAGNDTRLTGGALKLGGKTMTVTGKFSHTGGDLDVGGGAVTISGDYIHSSGTLNVNGGKVAIAGDYRIQTPDGKGGYTASGGVLYMVNEADKVTVNGSFVMDSTQSHGGNFQNGGQYFGGNYLQAGTLEVKGDFTQQSTDAFVYANYDFYAQGTHKVILSGTGTQKVSFEDGASGASHFANVEIQNTKPYGISFTAKELPAIGNLIYSGSTLYLQDVSFRHDLVLPTSLYLKASTGNNTQLLGGTLNINGKLLTLNSSLIHSGGTLNVNGGKVAIAGDYRIQTPDGKGGYTTSGGVLYMVNEADKVTVNGSFVIDSTQSHGGNFQNGGQYFGGNYLQAGTLEVKGDFTQQSTDAFVYANYDFYAQGTHKVILSGTGTQKVSFEDGASGASRFAQLWSTNKSGIKFVSPITVAVLFEHNRLPFTLADAANSVFVDYDGDGVKDNLDPLPRSKEESKDTDGDGTGDNADTDDDNDGVLDTQDAFPLDKNESVDTDTDGVGNNADTDDDNDGVPDTADTFPLDKNESADTDQDGVGNNADTDDDNDGIADALDAFPLDKNESLDTDKDGIGNNTDTDDDNDGMPDAWETTYGLNPLDAADANTDTDADGLSNLDEFKYGTNPTQADTDSDGASDKAEVDAGRNPVVNEGAVMQILDGMF